MFCTLNSIKANLRTCQNTMKKFVKFSLFTFKLRIANNLSFWRDFFWNSVECPVLLEFCKLVIMVYLKPDGDLFCWQRAERNFLWIWIPELWWKPGCKTWFFPASPPKTIKGAKGMPACHLLGRILFANDQKSMRPVVTNANNEPIHKIASTRMCWNLEGEESPRSSPSVAQHKVQAHNKPDEDLFCWQRRIRIRNRCTSL